MRGQPLHTYAVMVGRKIELQDATWETAWLVFSRIAVDVAHSETYIIETDDQGRAKYVAAFNVEGLSPVSLLG